MNHVPVTIALVLTAIAAGPSPVSAQTSDAPAHHVLVTPDAIAWGPAPPVLPAGAQVAVLDGDPFQPGFFTLRLKFPHGYRVPAHWHPTDEHITVMQGTFRAGMGNAFDPAGLHDFPTGSHLRMPSRMNHFAIAEGEVIVQISGEGPFVVNYVRAADDPSKAPAPR